MFSFSPGIKILDKTEPDIGIINLYMVTSPALLYFKSEYQRLKATADKREL
jgi:hypothetical protein